MNERQRATIARLLAGETVEDYREGGNSMTPLIRHRQPVTIKPVDVTQLARGDIVLVKVGGRVYTHKITALRKGQAQIGNNHGGINGWTKLSNIYGIVVEVDGRAISGAASKALAP